MNQNLAILFASTALIGACSKTSKPVVEPDAPPAVAKASTAEPAAQKVVPEQVARLLRNFQRVHFEFDSSNMTADSKQALKENTEIMAAHPDIKVEVQGHCDERGTTEYNLSLGQKRAEAIRKYLVTAGVSQTRVAAVSFGKEKPLSSGSGESAWAQNRRAEFRVSWERDAVASVRGTVD